MAALTDCGDTRDVFTRFALLAAGVALCLVCLATSAAGAVDASIDWGAPETVDPGQQILSIACKPAFGCLFGDDDGAVFVQGPGGMSAKRIFFDEGEQITTLKCISATRCLALDGYPGDSGGYFGSIVAINPITGRHRIERIPLHPPGPDNFGGVDGLECAGKTCTITSEYRAGVGAPTLRSRRPWVTMNAPDYLTGLSCGSLTFCLAVDQSGDAVESDAPTENSSWTSTRIVDTGLTSVACLAHECVAGTEDGALVTGTLNAPAGIYGPS